MGRSRELTSCQDNDAGVHKLCFILLESTPRGSTKWSRWIGTSLTSRNKDFPELRVNDLLLPFSCHDDWWKGWEEEIFVWEEDLIQTGPKSDYFFFSRSDLFLTLRFLWHRRIFGGGLAIPAGVEPQAIITDDNIEWLISYSLNKIKAFFSICFFSL